MQYQKELYEKKFFELKDRGIIQESDAHFKINLFVKKAEASLIIAINTQNTKSEIPEKIYWLQWTIIIAYYSMLYAAKAAILKKGYDVKTHDAAQIALGYLLVPDILEKEDLEILNQTHKIFEEEYITYFEDARTESNTARYRARPSYTERRATEITKNAKKFLNKITNLITDP